MVKIATHFGLFHADDVFAVAVLRLVYPDAEVVRTRDMATISSVDVVVDVGGVYDVGSRRFDHHQKEGAGKRENGIPYASFGLVWKEYGDQLTGSQPASQILDKLLAAPIDSVDNGFKLADPVYEGIRPYTIGDYFQSFIRTDDSMEELDRKFFRAVDIAQEILKNEIFNAQKEVEDIAKVTKAYQDSENKKIIILDEMIPWKKTLIPTEAVYVVAPRTDGRWQVRAVPMEVGSFELKKPLPAEWASLQEGDLAKVSEVPDAAFCHRDLFLAGAHSKEGAIALAKKALEG